MASPKRSPVLQACLDYVDRYWDRIIQHKTNDEGTLIGLPRPFVCADHDMFRELYYWDSYFIMIGLETTARQGLVVDITENFLYLLRRFGRIPNASRYYHLSRSQPPFLTSMLRKSYAVKLRLGEDPKKAKLWLREGMELAEQEYHNVWRGKKFPDHREVYQGLSRYYDLNIWHSGAEAESGWDMTPRFDGRCLDFVPIDLNCLLYQYELDFAAHAEEIGDKNSALKWQTAADSRRTHMSELLWDANTGFFYDYDFKKGQLHNFQSVAAFFALWSRLATDDQAGEIVRRHLPYFEQPHGVVTTEEWTAAPGAVSKQWAWPNGWPPLHWIVVSGLMKYGYRQEATRIARKYVDLVLKIFEMNQVNFEKYNVVNGTRAVPDRYPDQVGFAWTNAVFLRFVRLLETGHLWQNAEPDTSGTVPAHGARKPRKSSTPRSRVTTRPGRLPTR